MTDDTYSDLDRCLRAMQIDLAKGRLMASRDLDAALERCGEMAHAIARSQRAARDFKEMLQTDSVPVTVPAPLPVVTAIGYDQNGMLQTDVTDTLIVTGGGTSELRIQVQQAAQDIADQASGGTTRIRYLGADDESR